MQQRTTFPNHFSTTKILAPRAQPLFLQNMNFRSVSMETRRLSVEGPHRPPRHESLSILSLIVILSVIGPQSLAPSIPGPSILMSVRPSVCLSSCLPKQSACLCVCPDQFCKATTKAKGKAKHKAEVKAKAKVKSKTKKTHCNRPSSHNALGEIRNSYEPNRNQI